ncbi:hypothetical protein KGQ19_09720 [Catenulispora sp. NL8]|uniref:Uncharacterized protein n=1 Tax=Catenulispora pinistramenti TaxID=2705254 RepID=A0ABS5KMB2_9ACTN|nr:hypothetical protein [Catenulispora pinistramenti]MBS2547149.1 hypothetical protein [Catenulispora pinistramenti]
MLARTRRVSTLSAAIAMAVVAVDGAATAAASPLAPRAAASAARPLAAAAPQISTLPNGDRVLITGSGQVSSVAVMAPDGSNVPAVRYTPNAQHSYVIPESVLAAPAQFAASQYEIPALSAPSKPAVIPHFPMGIVQINGTGMDGDPANGFTFLTNVDDSSRWNNPVPLTNGVARVAVPTGHYSATTLFTQTDPTTNIPTLRQVVQLDITVAGTGLTTVTADERAATSQVTATTPRPAVHDSGILLDNRTDLDGQTSVLISPADGPTYTTATAPAQTGTFTYQVLGWGASSPAGTADPYLYDVIFPASDHIAANQSYQIDASKLATIHNAFDNDPGFTSHKGAYVTGSVFPKGTGVSHIYPITVPGTLTTYYGPPASGAEYARDVIPDAPSAGIEPPMIDLQTFNPAYTGPTESWRTWGHGPLTPQAGRYQGDAPCRSCTDGSTVDLGLDMLQDGNPDTVGEPIGPENSHFTVYRDGVQISSQDGSPWTEITGQSQRPGTYRLVYDQDLSQFPLAQSTATHTDITVPYTPTPDPAWTFPVDNICYARADSTTPCSILPVLNLNYQMATDDSNTSHGPVAALLLTVGHQSYGTAGANAAVTGATVSVSYDKGETWTPVSVLPAGPNHFAALWKNGAKGSSAWLKVTATDALGGSITQTVANAYTIG